MIELIKRYQINPNLTDKAVSAIPMVAKCLKTTPVVVKQALNEAKTSHSGHVIEVRGIFDALIICEWLSAIHDTRFGVVYIRGSTYKVHPMDNMTISQIKNLVHVSEIGRISKY